MGDRVTAARSHTAPQHVWVSASGPRAERSPGLLLEWRRRGTEWEALAVWVSGGGVRGWEVRQGWISAAHVRRRE